MCYGNPAELPRNFIPQPPLPNTVTPCNGLGMGATLFRLSMFKDPKIPRPWFKTVQEVVPHQGARAFTQDLYFFNNACAAGYKFACSTRTLTGHLDAGSGIVW
jgi:hypothetical protein